MRSFRIGLVKTCFSYADMKPIMYCRFHLPPLAVSFNISKLLSYLAPKILYCIMIIRPAMPDRKSVV